NLAAVGKYLGEIDTLTAVLQNTLPVDEQYEIIARAAVRFPMAEIGLALGNRPLLQIFPPSPADFPEKAINSQHALTMVIKDLFAIDRLTLFAVMLAVAIDAIVILMALAGSRITHRFDFAFNRLDKKITGKTKRLSLTDVATDEVLADNLERYGKINDYSRRLSEIILE
ncbi:MAG: hypothetical protein GY869_29765, partial [Planctomycetes bacterium]|nr:hypothetical protein [Planctomycetota bacterium]